MRKISLLLALLALGGCVAVPYHHHHHGGYHRYHRR
jgi:uncharacterized protein YceK